MNLQWVLNSDRPIYAQLVDELKLRIVSGYYPTGSKLPSVRDLASEASVNPNTMQRALNELENNGLIFTQRTNGKYVTSDNERIRSIKAMLAKEQCKDFIERMNNLGYPLKDAVNFLDMYVLSN